MSRSAATRLLAIVSVLVPLAPVAGCGGGASDPPKADAGGGGLSSLSGLRAIPKEGGGSVRVTMLLPERPTGQQLIWKEAAQLDASRRNVVFTVRTAGPGESMADLVRRASREGASAMIVVVDDPETLGPALAEVRGRGAGVVTILEPVTADGEPVPVVVRSEYDPAAEELVDAAREDAERLGNPADGPALVVYSASFPESDRRAEALFGALERAGIATLGDAPMPISGGPDAVEPRIIEVVEEHPELAMVLAGDDPAFVAAMNERVERPEGTGFSVAGFVVDPEKLDAVRNADASAAAFSDERVLGVLALRHAVALFEGESAPDRIVAPLPVTRASKPPRFGSLRVEASMTDEPFSPELPERPRPPGERSPGASPEEGPGPGDDQDET